MRYSARIFVTTLIAAVAAHATAQLRITEVMQSNIDCVMDDLNEFPDSWVELCNVSGFTLNLSGYAIGESADVAKAYTLPSRMVPPLGYVLVYCDKADNALHTDFRLDTGKNSGVFVFDATGQVIDSVRIARKQPAPNIAYGRLDSSSDEWGYQQTPTPAAANCGQLCTDILGEPQFSTPGQVFTSKKQFSVTLTMPEGTPDGTVIRYTTDGTEPTAESHVYTAPIGISGSTTVVRAKLFCDGWLSPRSTTQSYVFLGRNMTLPLISIVTDSRYLFDSKLGIYVDGSYASSKHNYEYDWRRPVNVEYFADREQASEFNQLCETRVSGAASRSQPLKSLVLYAHKRFGQKRFDYEFFPDQKPGLTDFKSVLLRNAGNDFDYLYMRDAIIQRTMAAHADLDWQAWHPAIIYMNGVYKGILNIRERSNEDNIYSNYDGLEDIDMVENWGSLKAGSLDSYNAFQTFWHKTGHTCAEYAELMDIDEYINLMIMNLYVNNLDFPGNNFMMWRPQEEGGRWRFVAKDTDFGLGIYNSSPSYETFKWFYNHNYDSSHAWANSSEQTMLFRRLMADETFARMFIDRCAVYMGDFLNYDGFWAIWGPMYDMIKTEYPIHRKLINQWWPNYSEQLTQAQTWLRDRTAIFYQQLASYYKLGAVTPMTIDAVLSDDADRQVGISFNGTQLSTGRFDGSFFAGRDVELQGVASTASDADTDTSDADSGITGWTVTTYQGTTPSVQTYEGASCHFVMPTATRVVVTAQTDRDEGIRQVAADRPDTGVTLYDLNGRRIDACRRGISIIRAADGSVRKVITSE